MKGHLAFSNPHEEVWTDGGSCNLVLPLQTSSLDSAHDQNVPQVAHAGSDCSDSTTFPGSKDAVLDAAGDIVQAMYATGNPIFEAATLSFGESRAYLSVSS